MRHESTEQLEVRIARTREALGSKMHQFHDRTVGEFQETLHAAQDSLHSLTSSAQAVGELASVDHLAEMVNRTVGEIPLKQAVRARPLSSVLTATAAGLLTGLLLGSRERPRSMPTYMASNNNQTPTTPPSAIDRFFERIVDQVTSEAHKVADEVVTMLGGSVKNAVADLMPDAILSRETGSPGYTGAPASGNRERVPPQYAEPTPRPYAADRPHSGYAAPAGTRA